MITFPNFPNMREVSTRERITFSCTACGACCKNVRDSILLNPLDAFRLVRWHWEQGANKSSEEILEEIADLKELSRGFYIYVLKTVEDSGVCIFFKNNRCAVYAARPATRRLYPFSPDFRADGTVDWNLCLEQPHHFRGGHVTAREWQRRYLKDEDILFFQEQTKRLSLIGKLLRKVPDTRLHEAEIQALVFSYFGYDYNEPFLPQYKENMAFLAARLKYLQNE